MTFILREHSGSTSRIACDGDDLRLRLGMQFLHAELPRGIEDDRRFIARMSEPSWDGIVLFGIETPADIEKASALLRIAEAARAMPQGALLILARLDTARAALGLARFDRPVPRLAGLVFDADVLALASGAAADSALVTDLGLRLPLAARASGAAAILRTDESGPQTIARARNDGYVGLWLAQAQTVARLSGG